MSRAGGLRILVMTPSVPFPPTWGFGMRVYQLLRHLARRHSVSLLTYATEQDAYRVAAIEELGVGVHTVPPAHPEGGSMRRAQLAALLSPTSYQTRQLRTRAMQRALDRLLASETFDAIQVESSPMAGFALGARTPLILDEHNIEYELLYRIGREERSPIRKLYNWIEYKKLRREEHRCWQRSAACILTSPREEEILRAQLPAKSTLVVPNGVDVEYFRPSDVVPRPDSIVFTGLMRYRPNADAVVYFARDIFPLIRRTRPQATFTIVGSGVPPEVARLAGPGVTVTGWVPDVRPYIAQSTVFAVPLRMGSGTRLKVLEGLATGKAMVSTALGCEGIAVHDGEHLVIADDPADFAAAILRLFDERRLGADLGRQGRALVEQQYGWDSVVRPLDDFYADMIERHEREGVPALAPA
jgi:polysaccharide biosynthesis protein PslH